MSTAIAPNRQASELNRLLGSAKQQIALALPRHLTPERMIRMAVTLFNKTPGLQECDPLSIVACVIQASELGLELTGPLGHAYMVPYRNGKTGRSEAQFQIGYRGLMDLAYRSGRVAVFSARVVYENDQFAVRYGTSPEIQHVPTPDDPGELHAVYALAQLKEGPVDFEVMFRKQVDAHRRRYSRSRGGSPWDSAYEEMAKKTVIRRLAKRLPLSVELTQAAVIDEYAEAGVGTDTAALLTPADRVKAALNGNGSREDCEPQPGTLASSEQIRAIEAEFHRLGFTAQDAAKAVAGAGAESLTKATSGQAEALLIELRDMQVREPGSDDE